MFYNARMSTLYIVDGSGYIFRAFFALTNLSNSKGLPTNALFGFLKMFGKLLREENPENIAVAFDRPEPTFRHEMYADYKANRDECPAELVPQLPYFRKIVEAMGMRSLEKAGVEADDIIATLVRRAKAEGQPVVVVSGDKDLLQLVEDGVTVYDAMRDVRFDSKAVIEKMGVPPGQIQDYLAIIGDSSDNVPGVKGVGPKTAVALLQHFGSLAKVLENPSEISRVPGLRGAKGVQEKIESSLDVVRLSHTLVGLDSQVEPFLSAQLSDYHWGGIDSPALRALCSDLEFRSGFENLFELRSSGAGSVSGQAAPETRYAGKAYTIITRDSLPGFADKLSRVTEFAFDTETTGLDTLTAELVGISFSWKRNEAFYLPLIRQQPAKLDPTLLPLEKSEEVPLSEIDVPDASEVLRLLKPIFENEEIAKSGYNIKFDIGVLAQFGIRVRGKLNDGMIAFHLLHPDRRSGGLKTLAQTYLGEQMLSYEELLGEESDILVLPTERIAHYASHDADATWGVVEALTSELRGNARPEDITPYSLFEQIEMPLIPVLSEMERTGIYVDMSALSILEQDLSKELKEIEARIYALVGREFNLNSPKQLAVVLFDELKLPTKGVKRTQSGYSTDASVLELLSAEHKVAAELLDYRELHKLLSTYVVALGRLVHPATGRVHTSFNQAIAATGRLSSTEPNLQNIPIKNERGRTIRKAFSAMNGKKIIAADYSQIELRILAHLSGDENLKKAFMSGVDIHQRTADEIFGFDLALTPDEKKERRRIAKTINFGVVYGMGAFRLSGELGVSRKEAQGFIDGYFARYPKVKQYYESVEATVESLGYSQTLFGRRRYLADIETQGRDPGYARRALQNSTIQGTAAEIIKLAMINLHQKFAGDDGVKMVLQVHDELVFEVDEERYEAAREGIQKQMESATSLDVPLVVDIRGGRNWGDAV